MTQTDVSKTQKTCFTDRYPQLSLMRVIACIAIVVLHTVFAANEYFNDSITASQELGSRLVENNMMWAVPLFLMVTGVLQLNTAKPLPLQKLYGKYIKRVLLALVIFSLVFRIFDMVMDGEALSFPGVLKAFTELLTAKGWGHLWYLYLLIGLYILMPFYRAVAERCSDNEMKYLAVVYIAFLSVIPIIESYGINIGFYISESLIYPLYLFLGHMIHEGRVKISVRTGAIVFVLSTLIIAALDVAKYGCQIAIPSILFGYSSVLVIAQSAGLFVLIDKTTLQDGPLLTGIIKTDTCTFSIYLVHMVFIRLLFRYIKYNPYETMPVISLTLCIILIFAVSYLLSVALKHIPGLSKII